MKNEKEKMIEIDGSKPQMVANLDVQAYEWAEGAWKGKPHLIMKVGVSAGSFKLLLWPKEANCLADLIKESLKGVDISYDMESAFKDLVDAGEVDPETGETIN